MGKKIWIIIGLAAVTAFGAFTRSSFGHFEESPFHARNNPTGGLFVLCHISGTYKYAIRTLTIDSDTTCHIEDNNVFGDTYFTSIADYLIGYGLCKIGDNWLTLEQPGADWILKRRDSSGKVLAEKPVARGFSGIIPQGVGSASIAGTDDSIRLLLGVLPHTTILYAIDPETLNGTFIRSFTPPSSGPATRHLDVIGTRDSTTLYAAEDLASASTAVSAYYAIDSIGGLFVSNGSSIPANIIRWSLTGSGSAGWGLRGYAALRSVDELSNMGKIIKTRNVTNSSISGLGVPLAIAGEHEQT